jgi:hypothetical protein
MFGDGQNYDCHSEYASCFWQAQGSSSHKIQTYDVSSSSIFLGIAFSILLRFIIINEC